MAFYCCSSISCFDCCTDVAGDIAGTVTDFVDIVRLLALLMFHKSQDDLKCI